MLFIFFCVNELYNLEITSWTRFVKVGVARCNSDTARHWFTGSCFLSTQLCVISPHSYRYERPSREPSGSDWYRVQLCLLRPVLSPAQREEERVESAKGK